MLRSKPTASPHGRLIAVAALAAGLLSVHTHAQTQRNARPAAAGRIVKAFDFEERDYNPLPVPFGWLRAQNDPNVPRERPGFPIWNGGILDYIAPAYSGVGTVRLPTDGGSTSLILRTGEVGVFPNADYMVTTRVRTQDLKHAQARIIARLLDQQGNTIKDTEVHSTLVQTGGRWEQLAVVIEGLSDQAAYLQLELQLLQPEQQPRTRSLSSFSVWEQDFSGAAFFDDVVIAQLPRLELTTGAPGNIVLSEQRPAIKILVRDLSGERIVARARVFDVHGDEVDHTTISNGERRVHTDWKPKLTKFGWYRAYIEVYTDDALVGIRTLDFFWAPPPDDTQPNPTFGIAADITQPPIADAIGALASGSRVGTVSVNVWGQSSTPEDFDPDGKITAVLDILKRSDLDISIDFHQVPLTLADALAVDTGSVLDVFASPMDRWNQWGGQLLDRYGQSVSRWSFGSIATEEPTAKLDQQFDSVFAEFSRFIPAPILTVPWSDDRPIDTAVATRTRGARLIDRGTTHADSMPMLIEQWMAQFDSNQASQYDGATLSLLQRPAEHDGFMTDTWSAAGSLSRKALAFWWAAGTSGIDLDRFHLLLADAWSVTPGKRAQVMPSPELHVWRTLATQLAGRTPVEELDLLDGARILLLSPRADEPESEGAMMVWLEDPSLGNTHIQIPLANKDLTQIDLFANRTPIKLNLQGELKLPMHRVEIRRTPVFIEGVNVPLARFLANIRITPDTLEPRSGIHHRELVLTNPWPYAISGRIFIVEPGGYTQGSGSIDRTWEIAPRVVPFAIEAGGVMRTEVEWAFSSGELVGTKPLVFDVELSADTKYPIIRVERHIQLAYDGLEVTSTARSMGDGLTEVVVTVTNRSALPVNLEAVAVPVREARARASINGLEPGDSVTRRFVFQSTRPGDSVIIGISIADENIRINSIVKVP